MAFSGGTFSRLYSWASDQSNGIKIRADRMDGEMDGMATGLSTCLLKDGTQTASARIPFAAGIKMGGQSIQLDPANSSAITAGTNNIIIVSANGADQVKFTDGTIEPNTDNDIDLGTASKEFKNAFFDGTVTTDALTLGASTSVTGVDADLSSVSASDDTLASAKAIKTYVDGQVTAQDLDFAGGSGTGSVDLDSQSLTIAGTSNEIETSASGQTLTVGLPTNVTISGELDVATLDVSGDADIDGTTNLDAVDIDGNVQLDGTLTVGVDDTGYDVKLFGATASAHLLWDASADKLLTAGGALIDIVKDKLMIGGTAVTTTAAELNVLDGITSSTSELNLLDAVARGKIIYGNASGASALLSPGSANQVLTSDGTDISWAAAAAGGKVLQVKSAFTDAYTTHANTNVDSPADILSVSITPTSASNKILVMGLFTGNSTSSSVQYLGVQLVRGTTEIGSGDASTRNGSEGELHSSVSLSGDYSKPTSVSALFLDSPSTTSATTYKLVAFANHFGSSLSNTTLVQNSGGYNYNNKEQGVGASSLIVMEVTP